MAVFFTSDTHFNHPMVAKLRGFHSVREHDLSLKSNWCKQVSPDDEVFLLGDIAMGNWREGVEVFRHLPGRIHLILGNHDRAHPRNSNSHNYVSTYMDVFASVQTSSAIKYKGKRAVMSHYPYEGEGATRADDGDRDVQWRLRDEGVALIHGHVHDSIRHRKSNAGTTMVHVGVDSWGMSLVPIHDVFNLIP